MPFNPYQLNFNLITTSSTNLEALQFRGDNTMVRFPHLNLSSGDFTVSFWAMPTGVDSSSGKNRTIVSVGEAFSIAITETGIVSVQKEGIDVLEYSGPAAYGAWRGYAVVVSGSSISLYTTTTSTGAYPPYVTGTFGAVAVATSTIAPFLPGWDNEKDWIVGARWRSEFSRYDFFMWGVIRDVGVWPSPLTQGNIVGIFNGSIPSTSSAWWPIRDGSGSVVLCGASTQGSIIGNYLWKNGETYSSQISNKIQVPESILGTMTSIPCTSLSKTDPTTGNVYAYCSSTTQFTVGKTDSIRVRLSAPGDQDLLTPCQLIDGEFLLDGDKVLLANQVDFSKNGIYTWCETTCMLTKVFTSGCSGTIVSSPPQYAANTMHVEVIEGTEGGGGYWFLRALPGWEEGCSLPYNVTNHTAYGSWFMVTAATCAVEFDASVDNIVEPSGTNISLFCSAFPVVDGKTMQMFDTVLMKDQTVSSENGVYVLRPGRFFQRYAVDPCSIPYNKCNAWTYATSTCGNSYSVHVSCGYSGQLKVFELQKIVCCTPCYTNYPSAAFQENNLIQSPTVEAKMVFTRNVCSRGNVDSIPYPLFDGVSLCSGDKVLMVGQDDPTQNGVYLMSEGKVLQKLGDWSKAESSGIQVYADVFCGTVLSGTRWVYDPSSGEFNQTLSTAAYDWKVDAVATVPVCTVSPVVFIDGVRVQDGMHFLLACQSIPSTNGIWKAYSSTPCQVRLFKLSAPMVSWPANTVTATGNIDLSCSLPVVNSWYPTEGSKVFAYYQTCKTDIALYSITSTGLVKDTSISPRVGPNPMDSGFLSQSRVFRAAEGKDNGGFNFIYQISQGGAISITRQSPAVPMGISWQGNPLGSETVSFDFLPGKDVFSLSFPGYKSGLGKVELWYFDEKVSGYTSASEFSGWQKSDFRDPDGKKGTWNIGTPGDEISGCAFFYNNTRSATCQITVCTIDLADYISYRQRMEFSHIPTGEYLLSPGESCSGIVPVRVYEIMEASSGFSVSSAAAAGKFFSLIHTDSGTVAAVKEIVGDNLSVSITDGSTGKILHSGEITELTKVPAGLSSVPSSAYGTNSNDRYTNIVQMGENTYGLTEKSPILGKVHSSGDLVPILATVTLENRSRPGCGMDLFMRDQAGCSITTGIYPRINAVGISGNTLQEIPAGKYQTDPWVGELEVVQYRMSNHLDRGYDFPSREISPREVYISCSVFTADVNISAPGFTMCDGSNILLASQDDKTQNGVYYFCGGDLFRNEISEFLPPDQASTHLDLPFEVDAASDFPITIDTSLSYVDISNIRYFHDRSETASTRILVTNQPTKADNGIYTVTGTGLVKENNLPSLVYDRRGMSYYLKLPSQAYVKLYSHSPGYRVSTGSVLTQDPPADDTGWF